MQMLRFDLKRKLFTESEIKSCPEEVFEILEQDCYMWNNDVREYLIGNYGELNY